MTDSAQDLPADPQPGDRVGPYVIRETLGEGGMGRVYKAAAADGSSVALKLVKSHLASDTTFRRRFAREAKIAQRVLHPNLVPVLDTGEHNGVPYLVQRFIRSGSLEDRLAGERRLDIESTLRVCGDVALGLDALCEADMVHRDVKPGNILLDELGVAYVTDFGLAKDTQGSLLTRPGQTLGSIDYMAPEQIRGETLTASADVYALACVVCECLSGSPPFADRKGMRVLWAHLQEDPPDPCVGRRDAPAQLAGAVLTGLRKEPAERPQTAGEFATRLREAARQG